MDTEVTASQLDCRAEDTIITIVPGFDLEHLELISVLPIQGSFGPFEANLPTDVPLWLALFLKKREKCKVIPPAWMDLEALDLKLQEERLQPFLSVVDFHYVEIAAMLLSDARDDVRNKAKVRKAVEDLLTLRMSKVRQTLKSAAASDKAVNMTNVAAMELQMFRSMVADTMTALAKVRCT